jgi:hypothetical protein
VRLFAHQTGGDLGVSFFVRKGRKGREDFKAWSAERRSLTTQPTDNLESLYFASFASFAENLFIQALAACLVRAGCARDRLVRSCGSRPVERLSITRQ